MTLREQLLQAIERQRPYAGHWHWHDQKVEEAGVLVEFLKACECLGFPAYERINPVTNDPPDFVAETSAGESVAIELTELVSREAVEANVQDRDNPVYRHWTSQEVLDAVTEILGNKDGKDFHGGPYQEIQVVLYTAEPVIQPAEYVPLLREHLFPRLEQISRAYLLFQFEPDLNGGYYPLVELKLGDSAGVG